MTDQDKTRELVRDFWKAIDKDRTVMLACGDVPARPMTALIEHGAGPVWCFTADDNTLAEAVANGPQDAQLMFASKDHDLFATVNGLLREHTDPAVVDRLWNPFVAAWYTGKDDPKLRLLRFEPGQAEIWNNATSLWAGLKMILGVDPKEEYKDDVTKVQLG